MADGAAIAFRAGLRKGWILVILAHVAMWLVLALFGLASVADCLRITGPLLLASGVPTWIRAKGRMETRGQAAPVLLVGTAWSFWALVEFFGITSGSLWWLLPAMVFAAVGLLSLASVPVYRKLAPLHDRVDEAWARLEGDLERRTNLLDRLRQIAQAFLIHETDVRSMRRAREVLALRGRVPALKADALFDGLAREFSEVETRIGPDRESYNSLVGEYSVACGEFPAVVFASILGFEPREPVD